MQGVSDGGGCRRGAELGEGLIQSVDLLVKIWFFFSTYWPLKQYFFFAIYVLYAISIDS